MGRDLLRTSGVSASIALLLALTLAAPAFADEPAPPPLPAATELALGDGGTPAGVFTNAPATSPLRRVIPFGDPYRPSVPVGETRAPWTTLAVPPTAFALTDGEAMTPWRGRIAISATRISDDRLLMDDAGRFWEADGETQVISLEYVTPGLRFRMGRGTAAIHFGLSTHFYTQQAGLFDGLRNWVEENLLGATDAIIAEHDIGGRMIEIDGVDMVEQSALGKARVSAKLQLPSGRLGCGCVHGAVSVGVTTPAWGSHDESGNKDPQPDVTLAYAWDLSRAWRITGATTVSLPGSTERFDELDIQTMEVIAASMLHAEWWPNGCWGFSLGLSYNTPYLEDSGLPMDDGSLYAHIGIQWRFHPRHELYLVWSENLDPDIKTFNTAPGDDDWSDSQKDGDFTFLLGWRWNL